MVQRKCTCSFVFELMNRSPIKKVAISFYLPNNNNNEKEKTLDNKQALKKPELCSTLVGQKNSESSRETLNLCSLFT